MPVKLLRIDSRLVHGQITTNWVKALGVSDVIVMTDDVQSGSLQYKMMETVTPHWLNLKIITQEQMRHLLVDPRFEQLSTMIIVPTVKDACFLVKQGLALDSINIGSLKFAPGKQMITEAIAVDQADVALFQFLHEQHIQLEVRKVFQDKSKDLWKLLTDKQLVLTDGL